MEAIGRAEAAKRARHWDEAGVLLWEALGEARSERDPQLLERLRLLAKRVRQDGTASASREAGFVLRFVDRPQAAERRGRLSAGWKIVIVVAVIAFVAASDQIAVLVNHGSFRAPTLSPEALLATPRAQPTPARDGVYLQPLGGFRGDVVERAATRLRARFPAIPVHVLPAIPIDRSAVVGSQLAADRLVGQVRSRYGSQPRGQVIVALTALDMRAKDIPWSFSLGFTDRIAVVSTARMDPENYVGIDGWRWGLDERLEKMLVRITAFMYLSYPPSQDPADLLYERIGNLDHLDAVDGEI